MVKELDKGRIADCFRAGAASYDAAAVVQREIGEELISLLRPWLPEGRVGRVLEIGCCTGVLSELLCRACQVEQLYLNDLVAELCHTAQGRVAGLCRHGERLPGDIETLQLPSSLDLVVSSATLQWIEDLAGLFSKIHDAMARGGLLAISLFSEGTMQELKALTGAGLAYRHDEQLQAMLGEGFALLAQCRQERRLFFPSLQAVLRHIRDTGVGGVAKAPLGMGSVKELQRRYRERFATEDGLPLTYVSTIILARKKAS